MNVLPFNFEFLDSDIALLTNQAGFHAYLSRMELNSLIDKNSTDDAVIDELLERKLFICDDEYKSASVGSLASGMSKRLMSALNFNPIFMIVPTLRCDHTCHYCQVSRASVKASNYDSEPDLIPLLLQRIRSSEMLHTSWKFRGRASLRFDLVQKIYQEAVSNLCRPV